MRQRIRRKSKLKGRQPDDDALAVVRSLIGPPPESGHRRDLLIEHLHRINDAYGGLRDRHLVALAREMNIPMAEVFEVATFYHHFEVVRGDDALARITVRVCDSLACELAGASDLMARLPGILGSAGHDDVRVVAAPCIGRCEQAPAVAVNQRAVPLADVDAVMQAVRALAESA
ncbi:MAG: NAD(P)H-dependent oxidoreductase subunit E, partial [Gammaproteobacteria bacterium]|nr:NAD(P)H-dependent oxidoreductase subunit E [Gammaproteobacteria bacterium]